jgi:polyisoprenoid-binding protein YceI
MRTTLKAFAFSLALAGPLFATAALAQAAPLTVPAGEYALENTHASITFRVKHLGLSMYTMRFASFTSTIMLDPKDPTKSTVTVSIDPKSVRTDFPFPEKENFDKKIADDFLKAGQFPTIRFQSTGLTATGATTGKLTGNLTMLGVTKPVTMDVKLNGAITHPFRKVPALGFSATGSFNRSDFGSKELIPAVGDEVQFSIETEYLKK